MELVIVMTLTVVVLGIIWTMFSIGNKIISDVVIKSDLQREGQAIQEQLSNIGMQATGIEPVSGDESTGEISIIEINSYENGKNGPSKTFEMKNESGTIFIGGKELSSHLESIKIINKEIINKTEEEISNNTYIDFTITLSKKKTYNNEIIRLPIKVRTVFRNKNIS